MARRRKYVITPGTVYTGRKTHRRVIHTFEHPQRGTRVVYSDGGIAHRECGYVQLRRWATATRARRSSADKVPRFALKESRA
jgi:hypothetical protein